MNNSFIGTFLQASIRKMQQTQATLSAQAAANKNKQPVHTVQSAIVGRLLLYQH